MFCLWGCRTTKPPAPSAFYKQTGELNFISRLPLPEAGWQEFRLLYEQNKSPMDTISYDSAFFHLVKVYNNSGQHFIGLTAEQMNHYCSWRNQLSNNAKEMEGLFCGNVFWKKLKRFDPNSTYQIEYFIPDYKLEAGNVSFDYPEIPAFYFSDTIIRNAMFSDTGACDTFFCFYVGMKYVAR